MKKSLMSFLQISTVTTLLLMSCNSLEENPVDFLSPENYFRNAAEADAVLVGAYNKLTNWAYYGREFYNLLDLPSDDAIVGNFNTARRVELDFFSTSPENNIVNAVWTSAYASILASNTVIDNVGGIEDDPTLLAEIEGQARFLRALNYFNLVRIWGPVPLVVSSELDLENVGSNGRNAVEDIFSEILRDLELAEEMLQLSYSGSDIGRATKGAAMTLLSKVFLTLERWDDAAEKAREVMNLNVYSLVPDYSELWLVKNQNGPEHIFSIQSKALVGVPGRLTRQLLPISAGGNGNVLPEIPFFEEFPDEDYRKAATFQTSFIDESGEEVLYPEWSVPQPHIGKYRDPGEPANLNGSDSNTNWPVFRYSEVLLIFAEALNEQNQGPSQDAYDAVNEIRSRARLEALESGLSYTSFRDAVRNERRLELAFEGKRWFDLARWNVLSEVLLPSRPDFKEHHKLFPIPQIEIDISGGMIEQNPGY